MNIDKNIYIHIPKTGGTSVINQIDQSMWIKKMPFGHDPLFLLEKNNDIEKIFKFSIVRNPYTRTFSYYKHFCLQNDLNVSFLEFLNFIKQKKYFKKTPMIVFPQTFYLYNRLGTIGVDKLYKFENFVEIENDFNVKLKKLRKGNYSEDEYLNSYTQECKELVVNLFSIDFLNFNYKKSL